MCSSVTNTLLVNSAAFPFVMLGLAVVILIPHGLLEN